MIDSHMHLEQKDYDANRDQLVSEWKKELKAIVTSCAHPRDLQATLTFIKKWPDFVFATAGFHPQYVKMPKKEIEQYLQKVKKNSDKFVGIGEIGLDYHWIKEPDFREKQRELFIELLSFAEKLKKPVIIHNWESGEDTIRILEKFKPKKVQLHMFGEKKFLPQILNNNWYISAGPILLKSKERKKIIRDMPLERIFLETDSPWFAQEGQKFGIPTNIRIVAEKIAEIKKLSFEKVWKQCKKNVIDFYGLKI